MTIEVKERPTRDVRGSSERHDREPSSSKPNPITPNIPKPPSKLSDESAASLTQINNIIRAIQSIKSGKEIIDKATIESIIWQAPENRRKEIHTV